MSLQSIFSYLFPKPNSTPQNQMAIDPQYSGQFQGAENSMDYERVQTNGQYVIQPQFQANTNQNSFESQENITNMQVNTYTNSLPQEQNIGVPNMAQNLLAPNAGEIITIEPEVKKRNPILELVDRILPGKKTQKQIDPETQMLQEAKADFERGMLSIKDFIAPTSMSVTPGFLDLSGVTAQSFYVYDYPRYIESNWLSPIVNFETNLDLSLYVYPMANDRIMKVLRDKVGQMSSHIRVDAQSGKARDPMIETALQDAEELRDQLARGEEKFFQLGVYMTVYNKDKEKLDKISKQIQGLLAGKLVMTRPALLRQEQAFNTNLPLCQDEIDTTRNMNTSPLSSSFPFSSTDLTSDDGILYGLNRHNNSLIIFDRFSLPNANSVVFATSGAGKSYAVKLEIIRSLMMDVDVIIIDPEDEYETLCEELGGSYLKVDLNSDRRINPFDLPLPIRGHDVQPGDLLRSNIITLEGLVSIMMGGNITPEERALLDKALIDTYALKGITMETENPGEIPPPTMEDLHDVLSEMTGAESLTTRLEQYTSGIYSGIFNKPTNVDLSSGLVVFSIRDLEESLRPTAMYVILNYIWNRVRSTMKKRLLIVDEAWSLMQHEDSAKFLYSIAKRCRKYYMGLTTITQDVSDFLKNDFGKAIVTNAAMQILLKQAPAAIDELTHIFNLTDGEKFYLMNSGQGEGIFFAGRKHVAMQVIASYSEHQLITTNPEEVLKREEKKSDLLEENASALSQDANVAR